MIRHPDHASGECSTTGELRALLTSSPAVELHPINLAVTDAYTAIDREQLKDPWDRFIVATAQTLQLPLVTADRAIRSSGLTETIW